MGGLTLILGFTSDSCNNNDNLLVVGFKYYSSMVIRCKVKYTDFQLVNITSGILYRQFLIDRDSCSNIVGYFCDVVPDEYIRIGKEN